MSILNPKTNPHDTAMPAIKYNQYGTIYYTVHTPGLTKREEFAKTFLAAIIAANDHTGFKSHTLEDTDVAAGKALMYADALIAELNKGENI